MHITSTPHFLLLGALVPALVACGSAAPPEIYDDFLDGTENDSTGDAGTDAGVDAGTDAGCTAVDVCPSQYVGIDWDCQRRFIYGLNYAWHFFGSDFGGMTAWEQPGVAGNRPVFVSDFSAMKVKGANVVRWWMFPNLRTEAIIRDGETITGVAGSMVADIEAALEIADALDMYLMLCLFSFDNFKPTYTDPQRGSVTTGIHGIVIDDAKRAALMENLVRPVARAVSASPYSHRMMAWDVINEPEWAVTGEGAWGDQDFDPTDGLEVVTYDQMRTFMSDVIAVLRQESNALVTIGAAAVKWRHAWLDLDQDFYQFHMYEWINSLWPYTTPPLDYGLNKPTVMGEFFLGNMDQKDTTSPTYLDMANKFYEVGYAGALGWQYIDIVYDRIPSTYLDDVKAFANVHSCETQISTTPKALSSLPSFPMPSRISPSPSAAAVMADEAARGCRRTHDGRWDCSPED